MREGQSPTTNHGVVEGGCPQRRRLRGDPRRHAAGAPSAPPLANIALHGIEKPTWDKGAPKAPPRPKWGIPAASRCQSGTEEELERTR